MVELLGLLSKRRQIQLKCRGNNFEPSFGKKERLPHYTATGDHATELTVATLSVGDYTTRA